MFVVRIVSSNDQNEEEMNGRKENLENSFFSSSGQFVVANKDSMSEQSQTIRKFYRHYHSTMKNSLQRSKTLELLPPLVCGKRLRIPMVNHQH